MFFGFYGKNLERIMFKAKDSEEEQERGLRRTRREGVKRRGREGRAEKICDKFLAKFGLMKTKKTRSKVKNKQKTTERKISVQKKIIKNCVG